METAKCPGEDCWFCTGEACARCDPRPCPWNPPCECDTAERHPLALPPTRLTEEQVRERLEAKWPADCFATLAGDVLSAPQDNGLLLRSVAVRWVHDHYEEVGDDGTE